MYDLMSSCTMKSTHYVLDMHDNMPSNMSNDRYTNMYNPHHALSVRFRPQYVILAVPHTSHTSIFMLASNVIIQCANDVAVHVIAHVGMRGLWMPACMSSIHLIVQVVMHLVVHGADMGD